MQLAELLAAASGTGDRDPYECPITGDDAVAALKAASAAWHTKHVFKPGDIIRQKDGFDTGERSGHRDGNPCVFVEYRDMSKSQYGRRDHGWPINLAFQDCVVGWINRAGGVVFSPAMSDIFEPA